MDASPPLLVACLCAQWCGVCREYATVFERAAAKFDARCAFVWVDIEDEADLLDGLEVDDFPTLLIGRGDQALFLGNVTPHVQMLARLVQRALAGELLPGESVAHTAAAGALVQRLAGRVGNPGGAGPAT